MHRSVQATSARVAWVLMISAFALGVASLAKAEDVAAARTPSPEGAHAYIISPANGATVSSPVLVRFGLSGIGVAPAGVINANTGHHHLIVDAPTPEAGAPIAKDDQHVHFGGGQTEASVELAPGTHTLQLLLGDHVHIPHDPPVTSEMITITVE